MNVFEAICCLEVCNCNCMSLCQDLRSMDTHCDFMDDKKEGGGDQLKRRRLRCCLLLPLFQIAVDCISEADTCFCYLVSSLFFLSQTLTCFTFRRSPFSSPDTTLLFCNERHRSCAPNKYNCN